MQKISATFVAILIKFSLTGNKCLWRSHIQLYWKLRISYKIYYRMQIKNYSNLYTNMKKLVKYFVLFLHKIFYNSDKLYLQITKYFIYYVKSKLHKNRKGILCICSWIIWSSLHRILQWQYFFAYSKKLLCLGSLNLATAESSSNTCTPFQYLSDIK